EVTDVIKDKAMGQNVLTTISPGQLLTKIVSDELTLLMGGTKAEINLKGDPNIILISGLQGSGKTTFSGKLARYLKSHRNVLLVAYGAHRRAALGQMNASGQQIALDVHAGPQNQSARQLARHALR